MKANSTEKIAYLKCFIPMGILDFFFSFLFKFAKERFVFPSSVFSGELTVRRASCHRVSPEQGLLGELIDCRSRKFPD